MAYRCMPVPGVGVMCFKIPCILFETLLGNILTEHYELVAAHTVGKACRERFFNLVGAVYQNTIASSIAERVIDTL